MFLLMPAPLSSKPKNPLTSRYFPRQFSLPFFSVLLLLAIAHVARAQSDTRGTELLRAMLNAERTLSYTATETTTRQGGATTVAHLQKSQGKKRLEYSAPAIMRGDLLIDNGQVLWRYHRAEKSAVKTRTSTRRANRSSRSAAQPRLSITAEKQKSTLSGRSAWIVVITRSSDQKLLRKIWIDEQTKLRLRTQRFDNNGKIRETTTLSNIRLSTVPAHQFNWTPPAGVSVTNAGTLYSQLSAAQRNAPWLRVPSRVPAGYSFESAVIGTNESWLRYSNSVNRFSIFQQRAQDQKTTPLRQAGRGWFWQRNGNRFLVAGISEAQAKIVAQSIRE